MASLATAAVGSQPDPNMVLSLKPVMSKVGPNYGAMIVTQSLELTRSLNGPRQDGVGTYIDKYA